MPKTSDFWLPVILIVASVLLSFMDTSPFMRIATIIGSVGLGWQASAAWQRSASGQPTGEPQ